MTLTDTGPLIALINRNDPNHAKCVAELMKTYQDTPMDLADASIVAAAEQLGATKVFTLDSDFHIYRLADGSTLQIIP